MESSILLTNICCRDYSSFVLFRIYSYFGNFPQDLFWKISTNCVPCVLGGVCPRSRLQRWGKILAGPIRVFHSPSLEWFKDEDVVVFVFFSYVIPGNTRRGVGTWDRKGEAAHTECVISAVTVVGYVEMILLRGSFSGTQCKAGPPARERPSAKKCSPDCWDLGQVAVKWWVHRDRGWDAESTCCSLSDLVSGHLPCFSAWPKYELSFIYLDELLLMNLDEK